MPGESCVTKEPKGLGFFEKYLTIWVLLCIGLGIMIGKVGHDISQYLNSLSIYLGEAPIISIPIPVALFFGTAHATVVGVLKEVPTMLMSVKICLRNPYWFKPGM